MLAVSGVSIDELDRSDPFRYDVVRSHIEKERQRSMAYLKEAIE